MSNLDVADAFALQVSCPMWALMECTQAEHLPEAMQSFRLACTEVLLHLITDFIPPAHSSSEAFLQQIEHVVKSFLQLPESSNEHGKAALDGSIASGCPLEKYFVLISSAMHLYSLTHNRRTPCANAGNSLPIGVAAVAKAVAECIFDLPRAMGISQAKDLWTAVHNAVTRVWFIFLFIFLQQLSVRGGDVTGWSAFFLECKQAEQTQMVKSFSFSDDEDDDDDGGGNKGTSSEIQQGVAATTPSKGAQESALRAWGRVTPELCNETIARARFRRAALLFKSNVPHMVSQAPGTAFAMVDLLHQFSLAWQAAISAIPLGQLNDSVWARYGVSDGNDFTDTCDASLSEKELSLIALIEEYGDRLGVLLGEGAVHGYLLSTVLGAVLCADYILPQSRLTPTHGSRPTVRASGASRSGARGSQLLPEHGMTALEKASCLAAHSVETCSEREWVLRKYPPLGRLLTHLSIRTFLAPHLFFFSTQLRIGLSTSHHVEGRQKFSLLVLLFELCDLPTAFVMYHFAAEPPVSSDGKGEPGPPLPYEALRQYTAAVHNYVKSAEREVALVDTTTSTTLGDSSRTFGHHYRNGKAPPSTRPNGPAIPSAGERLGERFSRMVFSAPCPAWTQYLLDAAAPEPPSTTPAASTPSVTVDPAATSSNVQGLQANATLVSPCRFVLDLLAPGYYQLAVRALDYFASNTVNVFLVPRRCLAYKVNVQVYVIEMLTRRLYEWEEKVRVCAIQGDATSECAFLGLQMRVLHEVLPLLRLTQTYAATQTLLVPLCACLTSMCAAAVAPLEQSETEVSAALPLRADSTAQAQECFALTEQLLVHFIMPCLRVLPPSTVLYDYLHGIFDLWKRWGPIVRFGTSSVEFLHTSHWVRCLMDSPLGGEQKGGAHDGSSGDDTFATPLVRHPHDLLHCKEQETLFVQSLKRMNTHSVDHYRNVLRQVMLAEPLFVMDKLLIQAVGYENSFLAVHTRLLRGLPAPVYTILFHLGLSRMRTYAIANKIGTSENRVSLVAHFVANVWRDNVERVDGGILLRAVELALRHNDRGNVVMGMELLKALLYQLLGQTLEHEEQLSEAQYQALMTPRTTRWFGKGAAESFRAVRWNEEGGLTLASIAKAREVFTAGLQLPCTVPLEEDEEIESTNGNTETEEKPAGLSPRTLPLGQHILLHLCRLHSVIYDQQADLDGTMETILRTSARDCNVLNDLIMSIEDMLVSGPPEGLLTQVALPHMALCLSSRFRRKKMALEVMHADATHSPSQALTPFAVVPPMGDDGTTIEDQTKEGPWALYLSAGQAVGYSLMRQLSYFTAAHFTVDAAPYAAAQKEVQACLAKASGSYSGQGDAASIRWLRQQEKQIQHEKEIHQQLCQRSEGARRALLQKLKVEVIDSNATAFAVCYLLPRALLGLEEVLFVQHFLLWWLEETKMTEPSPDDEEDERGGAARWSPEHSKVVDVVLSLVTAAFTFFVGLTDGECKRVGYLLGGCLSLLVPTVLMSPVPAAVSRSLLSREGENGNVNASNRTGNNIHSSLSGATFTSAYLERRPRTLLSIVAPGGTGATTESAREGKAKHSHGAGQSCVGAQQPAYPLQLDAYLCKAFVQLLSNLKDIPPHLHRNAFLVLERLDKTAFPSTLCCAELLLRAVSLHNDKDMPNFASASAVLKLLRGNVSRKRAALESVTTYLSSGLLTSNSTDSGEDAVREWLLLWRLRENYTQQLLLDELSLAAPALERNGCDVQDEDEILDEQAIRCDSGEDDADPQREMMKEAFTDDEKVESSCISSIQYDGDEQQEPVREKNHVRGHSPSNSKASSLESQQDDGIRSRKRSRSEETGELEE